MAEYKIDLSRVTDVTSLHEQLMESLPLPAWYGRNLDALYDALTDLSGEVLIRVTGQDLAPAQMRDYLDRLGRVLRDAQEELPGLTVFFSEDHAEDNYEDPGLPEEARDGEDQELATMQADDPEAPDLAYPLQEDDPGETTEH